MDLALAACSLPPLLAHLRPWGGEARGRVVGLEVGRLGAGEVQVGGWVGGGVEGGAPGSGVVGGWKQADPAGQGWGWGR